MKRLLFFYSFILVVGVDVCCALAPGSPSYLTFLENKGQWEKQVLYKAEIRDGAIFLENNCITFNLLDTADVMNIIGNHHKQESFQPQIDYTMHFHAFRMKFNNAFPQPVIEGTAVQKSYSNFFIGNDKSKWASKVREFKAVEYSNLYNKLNLKVSSQGLNMKYLYELQPGADLDKLNISFDGVNGLSTDASGNLLIQISFGTFMDLKPYAYQIIDGQQVEVPCDFLVKENAVSYSVPQGYNKNLPLYIDPTLVFSTYSGSLADNFGYTATYDSKGDGFEAGSVFGIGYPTTMGAYNMSYVGGPTITFTGGGTYPGDDIAISKFSPDGTQRIFATYLGGYGEDLPHSLIANANDELIVLGTTSSANYPTTAAAYDTVFHGGPDPGVWDGIAAHYTNGSDIVITRFSEDGSQLLASTYVGGSGNDGLNYAAGLPYSAPGYLRHNYADEVRGDIELDKTGNIYVASSTRSTDFPHTTGAYHTTGGGQDACVFKMDANLTTMIWSTTIGGSDDDAGYSLAIANDGSLFIAGGTRSTDFPVTAGATQVTFGGGDADGFVAHLDKNGQTLLGSTYYGFAEYDQAYFVQLDRENNVFLFGQADSSDSNYIYNAQYFKVNGGEYIAKFNYALDSIVWSTSFGRGRGVTDISPTAFLVDVCGNIYACGWGCAGINDIVGGTGSGTGGLQVTSDAYKLHTDGQNFYLMVIKDDASALVYATFMGGNISEEHVDGGTSRFDKKGVVYESVCAGCGGHSDFPTTPGAVSDSNRSDNCNNLIFKFDFGLPLCVAKFSANSACTNIPIAFVNQSSSVSVPTYQWSFGDGNTSASVNPVHSFSTSGVYQVTLVITDTGSCNYTDTFQQSIVVIGNNTTDTLAAVSICPGVKTQIGISSVADSGITYQWTPSNSLTAPNTSNPIATPAQNTLYQLIVSNGICTDTLYQMVDVLTGALNITAPISVCANDTLQLTVSSSPPGIPLAYAWQPTAQIISGANTATPTIRLSQTTVFTVTATSSAGCQFFDSVQVTTNQSQIISSLTAIPDTISSGDSAQLSLKFGSNVISFNWVPDTTLSSLTVTNPYAAPKQTNSYYVQLTDSQSCKKLDTVTVYVLPLPCSGKNLYIPNAFSPNGDGKNDVLYMRGSQITSIYFAVYDRWGQRMFETHDINQGWDGTYKGQKMDAAVFGYYAKGECATGEKFEKKGNVTLLK